MSFNESSYSQEFAVNLAFAQIATKYASAQRKHRVASMLKANAQSFVKQCLMANIEGCSHETAFAIVEHAINAYYNPADVEQRAADAHANLSNVFGSAALNVIDAINALSDPLARQIERIKADPQRSNIARDGHAAALVGMPAVECAYTTGSHLHTLWMIGYDSAFEPAAKPSNPSNDEAQYKRGEVALSCLMFSDRIEFDRIKALPDEAFNLAVLALGEKVVPMTPMDHKREEYRAERAALNAAEQAVSVIITADGEGGKVVTLDGKRLGRVVKIGSAYSAQRVRGTMFDSEGYLTEEAAIRAIVGYAGENGKTARIMYQSGGAALPAMTATIYNLAKDAARNMCWEVEETSDTESPWIAVHDGKIIEPFADENAAWAFVFNVVEHQI